MTDRDDLLILGDGPGAQELALAAARLGLRWRQVLSRDAATRESMPGPDQAGWPWPEDGCEAGPAAGDSDAASVLAGRWYLNGHGGVVCDTGGRTQAWSPRLMALAPRARPVRPSWWRGGATTEVWPAADRPAGGGAPQRVVVIGGGHTGVEIAGAWADGHREVLLSEAAERILPQWDADQSVLVQAALADRGVTVLTGARAVAVETSLRSCTVRLRLAAGTMEREEIADLVVPALGWRPMLGGLGLERTRTLRDRDGFLQVDSRLLTAAPGLHALGVAVALPLTRGTAAFQAQVIAAVAAGCDPAPLRYAALPRVARGPVPALLAGLTAEAARARGFQVACGQSGPGAAWVRCVRDAESGQALGVQAVGPPASTLAAAALHLLATGVPEQPDDGTASLLAEAWRRATVGEVSDG